MKWWEMAADQGLSTAELNLAQEYAAGTDVDPDYVQSYKWAALAAQQGEDGADDVMMAVTAEMSPEQLAAARVLVKDWRPGHPTGA
jgi:localization factor PodJL